MAFFFFSFKGKEVLRSGKKLFIHLSPPQFLKQWNPSEVVISQQNTANSRQGPNKNMEQLQQGLTPGLSHTLAFWLSCSQSVNLDGDLYASSYRNSGCSVQSNQWIKAQLWTRRLQALPVPWGCQSPAHFTESSRVVHTSSSSVPQHS